MILTTELRNTLMRAAVSLLPEAIRQAKPQPKRAHHPAKPSSPALLRLIARLAMSPMQIEKPR
jgi:hypothetical protein